MSPNTPGSESLKTPHRFGFDRKPWEHLGGVLKFVIAAILALATPGCSARVEVTLLQTRSPEPVATAKPSDPPPPPKPVASGERSVSASGNTTIILNYRGGDTHNETHLHIYEAPSPRIEERIRRWRSFPQGY